MTIDNYENVVVTGASSGIGEAVARDLSQAGLNVHAIARRTERLEELAANTNCTVHTMDVCDSKAFVDLLETIEADVLINNAGIGRGYGNLVEIKHTEDYSTRYAHLNKFHSKIKVGEKVKQSETIGYVGRTGTATGDHLHYEFRVNGKHTNPVTVKLPNAKPIHENDKDSYDLHAKKIIADLKKYQNLSF